LLNVETGTQERYPQPQGKHLDDKIAAAVKAWRNQSRALEMEDEHCKRLFAAEYDRSRTGDLVFP